MDLTGTILHYGANLCISHKIEGNSCMSSYENNARLKKKIVQFTYCLKHCLVYRCSCNPDYQAKTADPLALKGFEFQRF